ncbi:uncharacterized protein MYCGRDRAFT_90404 [Zymoseptoria tritici IPO323]|uniref:Major facilitator superfamily (MFS) profile domain-containing protein n=1 Tax=Zymoseptoria tritici (strain CBS 115943 / IPO323) TaxID=336722 RepID=F9X2M8_ZYMTI|nr:uncharacterized protein MYCGRDRAFT_90404 [Zymoseptoria tritici IPO323]EGP90751.1 hypothetical protein MYCGRDRAFT_90404 [Zymoseptoria tritici IPO323]
MADIPGNYSDKAVHEKLSSAEKDGQWSISEQELYDAVFAENAEHQLGVWEAAKKQPVMEAYDMFLNGKFVALPAFQKRFGDRLPNGKYSIDTKWQSGLNQAGQCGAFIGLFLAGPITNWIGYRWNLIFGLILMNATIFAESASKTVANCADISPINVVVLILLGVCATVPQNHSTSLAQAALVFIGTLVFAGGIGPVSWTIIAETSSVRLRPLTTGVGRAAYYVAEIPLIYVNARLINPTGWNLAGKCGYVWGATALVCWVIAYLFLPEMKHRSYRELDILFEREVPARQFKYTVIDVKDNE